MILIESLCVILNIISLLLGITLKRLIREGEYVQKNRNIRKAIVAPVATLVILIIYIIAKPEMPIPVFPIFLVFEVIILLGLSTRVFETELFLKDRIKYININDLLFNNTNKEDVHVNISKEFINVINSKNIEEDLEDFKFKNKFSDIQMNYLLESVTCKSNNKSDKYYSYMYIYDELKLIELNKFITTSCIKDFEHKNMLILDEYEILRKVAKINKVSEHSTLDSSAYFILMNYLKLKEDTTEFDEVNYIKYKESKSDLFQFYFKELNRYFGNLETEIFKISLKAFNEGVPIETISNITGISILKLKEITKEKLSDK